MLETTIGIDFNVKGDKLRKDSEAAAQAFAKRIESSLKNTVRALGLDKFAPVAAAGGDQGKGTAATGVALGLIAGGVMGILNMLADFPVISAVMKMFKAVLMLLLLPLVPILKPVMLALGLFMKLMMPIMVGISKGIENVVSALGKFLLDIGAGIIDIADKIWEQIKSAWTWTLDFAGKVWSALKAAWTWTLDIADKIWNAINGAWTWALNIAGRVWNMFVSFWKWELDIAGKIWNMLVSFWKWEFSIAEKVWDALKTAWTWTLDVAGKIWATIKATWTWGLDLAAKLWEWIKTQLGDVFEGGTTTSTKEGGGDFVITPTGQHIKTDPADYVFATKNPQNLVGGTSKSINLTLNITGNQFRDRSDIDYMKREITSMIRSEMRAAGR